MTLSLVLVSLIILGCQSKENVSTETTIKSSPNSENNKNLSIEKDFVSIGVSKTKGIKEIIYDDKESLKAFQDVFSSAASEPGIVNMTSPEFYMDVVHDKNNQQSLYLWIGKKGQKSTFMKAEDSNTIYFVPEEMTDKLIEFVKSRSRVDVTLQAKDKQGNLVPNVVFRVDSTITEDIGVLPDEDGIQTLNLEANSFHRVKVNFGNSIETIEEFLVRDEPMTFDIIKPE